MKRINKYSISLIVLVSVLVFIGLVFIYSASSYSALKNYNDAFYFVKKQLIGLILGVIALIITYKFSLLKYDKLKYYIIGFSLLLLILVFIPFLSYSANGANRWINIGGINIQASEVAKFGFVIFSASLLAKNYKKTNRIAGIWQVIVFGGIICFLILLEPNLSVTLCVGMVMLIMLFVGGISKKHLLMILIPALALVPILIIIEPYRFQRLIAFINPWANPLEEGYQLIQSLYSLGSGGLFGVGLFNSRQKFLFLPFSESDFIFSIIAEETGFIGAIILLLIYIALIIVGFKIAKNATTRFNALLAFGITSLIACQTLINVAVVTGSIPPTGIPLPFISAGGSSLAVLLGAVGILLNINKQSQMQYAFEIPKKQIIKGSKKTVFSFNN